MSEPPFTFDLCTENKYVIYYSRYVKSILNDDSFKKYINPVVFFNLKYML